MANCKYCGGEMQTDNKVCPNCGQINHSDDARIFSSGNTNYLAKEKGYAGLTCSIIGLFFALVFGSIVLGIIGIIDIVAPIILYVLWIFIVLLQP